MSRLFIALSPNTERSVKATEKLFWWRRYPRFEFVRPVTNGQDENLQKLSNVISVKTTTTPNVLINMMGKIGYVIIVLMKAYVRIRKKGKTTTLISFWRKSNLAGNALLKLQSHPKD